MSSRKYTHASLIIKIIIIVFIVCHASIVTLLFANTNGSIYGTVVSLQENAPISSATVVLHSSFDSTIVAGAITQSKGYFSIGASEGVYYLKVRYLGYETKIIDSIVISKNNIKVDLGEIKISQASILQDEVTVEAEKEQVVFGIDSKIFNIDKDITSGAGNVLDVLRKIPSINVDIDDNITMNGTAPKILIDGRESNYSKKEVLKVLSSDLVESVELITNPSAKYESEGVSGIIDIKFKEQKDKGFNGMLNLNASTDEEFKYQKNTGLGFTGNYRLSEKFNLFGSFNYNKWDGNSDWLSNRTTWLQNDTVFTNRNGQYDYLGDWFYGKIGIDYLATLKDAIAFSVDIGINSSDNGQSENYLMRNNILQSLKKYDIYSINKNNGYYFNTALNYKKSFEEKGHNLYLDVYFSNNDSDGENKSNFDYYETIIEKPRRDIILDNSNEKMLRTVIQADYEKTFSNILGTFGAGIKSIFRQIDNNNTNLKFNLFSNSFDVNKNLSDEYKFKDIIHAAYFTIGNKIENFSYRLGLRTEYTNWNFDSRYKDSLYTDKYLSLVPTVHLKYSIDYMHTFSVSYSRRISRPWYGQLNPFINLLDSNSINSGNPELKASYYNSYQVDYMLFTPKTTITTSAFYKNTDNASQYYHVTTDWGGLYSKPINVAKHASLGASISFMQTITDWWNINTYFSLINTKYDAPAVGIHNKEQTSWSVNLSSGIKILEDLRVQIMGFYAPASISLQGNNSAYYNMSVGVNYEFLNKKMSLNLSGYNLIYPKNNEYSNFGEYFSSYSVSNWMHRSFSVGLSYKINNFEQKHDNRRLDNNGEQPSGGGMGGAQQGGI